MHAPRDGRWQEDRAHRRASGTLLAWVRNLARTRMRHQEFTYVPNAWRFLSTHAEDALHWLVRKLK